MSEGARSAHVNPSLWARLDDISRDLLSPGDFHNRLAPAVTAYASMLFELASIDSADDEQRAHLQSGQGQAIGTFWAACCVKEVKRTQRFCRGLFKAVASRVKAGLGRPAHVIYAGTGPFAALALPVMRRFSPQEVQFSLLEMNPVSLEKLKRVVAALEVGPWIRRMELCDATVWRAPEERVDILISETMNQALKKEPQVGIMVNFEGQFDDSVTFIPETVAVGLGWEHSPAHPPEPLVDLLVLTREELKKVLARSPVLGEWVFAPVVWNYQPREGERLVYTTSIGVFQDETLNHNDSSLTLPDRVRLPRRAAETWLRFEYRTSPAAGFEVRSLARSESHLPRPRPQAKA